MVTFLLVVLRVVLISLVYYQPMEMHIYNILYTLVEVHLKIVQNLLTIICYIMEPLSMVTPLMDVPSYVKLISIQF